MTCGRRVPSMLSLIVLIAATMIGTTDSVRGGSSFSSYSYVVNDSTLRLFNTARFANLDNSEGLDIAAGMGGVDSCMYYVFSNSGSGSFHLSYTSDSILDYVFGVEDLNNDGYGDLVAVSETHVTLLLNDSTSPGSFSMTTTSASGYSYIGQLSFGDIDGDDDVDAVRWHRDNSYVSILRFDADSLYLDTAASFSITGKCTYGVADGELFDFDGDDDIDIVSANGTLNDPHEGESSLIGMFCNYDGTGDYRTVSACRDSIMPDTIQISTTLMASGLFDTDAYTDIVIQCEGYSPAWDSLLFFYGDGSGDFTYDHSIQTSVVRQLEAADVDGDSDVDFFAGTDSGVVVWFNDGYGDVDSTNIIFPQTNSNYLWGSIDIGDADGDGDEDILFSLPGTVTTVGVIFNHASTVQQCDCDSSGYIDYVDYGYLVDYLYSSGPAPYKPGLGDCNFDGVTDSLDVNFLNAYFYMGGPAPLIH